MSFCDLTDAIRREVEKIPGVEVTFGNRAKHKQAVLHYGDRTRFVTLSSTPGKGPRQIKNHLRDVRRELRNLGAVH